MNKVLTRLTIADPKVLTKWVQDNRYLVIYSILIAVVAYGYELFNFTLSIDEEIAMFGNREMWINYIKIGRWGTFLLNQLFFSYSLLPYLPFLIGIFCLAMSAVFLTWHTGGNLLSKLVLSTVFITTPVHAYYLTFNTAAPFFGLAMLLTVISFIGLIRAIDQNNRILFFISVLLIVFSLAIYQAFVAFFITLAIFHLLNNLLNVPGFTFRKLIRRGATLLLFLVIAVMVYQLTDLLFRYFFSFQGQENQEYLDNFRKYGKAPLPIILQGFKDITISFLTGKNLQVTRFGMLLTFQVLLPLLIVVFLREKMDSRNKWMILALMLLLFFAPFSLIYLNGSELPYRTMVALPLSMSLIWWLLYSRAPGWGKNVLLILACSLLISNTTAITRLFHGTWVSWQADRDMANRIYERICMLENREDDQPYPVVFVGTFKREANMLFVQSEVFGASFFSWAGGKPRRINSFFKTIGINDLQVIKSDNIIASKKDTLEKLPVWPRKGSVCKIDQFVVVKLGKIK